MIRAVRRRRRTDAEAGMTVIELVVAMVIFTVVIAVYLAGLVVMTQSTVRAQDVVDSGDAVRLTFQTMDKQIRYASSVNTPGLGASGSLYVEFLTTERDGGAEPLCTQWRFDPTERTVGYRTWLDVPSPSPSSWRTTAWDVRNVLSGPTATPPFRLVRADTTISASFDPVVPPGNYRRQQLVMRLDVGRGDAGPSEVTGADVATVFVARNSSFNSPSNPDLNSDGVSDTLVCNLGRP